MTKISGIALNEDFTVCANGVITFTKLEGDRGSNVQGNTNSGGHFEVQLSVGTWQSDKVIVSGTIKEDED